MKKLTSTLALASVLFFASCSKDDAQDTTTETSVPKSQIELLQEDSWDFESTRTVATMNGVTVLDETENYPGQVTFLKNNTVVFIGDGDNDISNYSYSNNQLIIDDLDFSIITLTESDLVLESEETEMDDDLNAEVTITTTLTFKK